MSTDAERELVQEIKELRQLLQAGVMLVSAVLGGDIAKDDLQEWVDQVGALKRS